MHVTKANKFTSISLSSFAFLTLGCGLAGGTPAAEAQSTQESVSIEEALRICNRIKNSRDRLDCFEGLADAAAPEADTTARNQKGEEKAPVTPKLAKPLDGQADSPESGAEGEPSASRKRFVILPEEEAKERLNVPLTPREKGEPYTSTIRKVWFNSEDKLMILLNNGEIWKQNQSDYVRKPKAGTEVALKKTRFGSWFVKVPPNYRSVRMRIINP